jgi:hypothetical protein
MRIRAWTLGLSSMLLVGVAGCSSAGGALVARIGRVPEPDIVLNYPPAPDDPRIQFLAALSDEGDLRQGKSGGRSVGRPYGVGLSGNRIFLCVPAPAAVATLDLDAREIQYFQPWGEGTLRSPVQCEPDADTGDLYVVDSRRGDVLVYDSLGSYVGNIEVPGGRAGDVVVVGDSIWVSDAEEGKILVFDKRTRTHARSLPEYERGSEQGLVEPINFAVTEDRVVVSNFGKFDVQVYTLDGEHVRTVGGYGRGWGQFIRNKGVDVDRDGNIYVVDAAFNNVQVFSQTGELLLFFGGPYQGLGGMYLPAGLRISYDPGLLQTFSGHVAGDRELEYLIFVTNQYGPDQVSVYGFLKADTGP